MIVGKARNVLVGEVLTKTDAEVLWFIDQDVLVPPNAGVMIDEALKYDIVSGLYFNRHSPYTPQMYRLSPFAGEEGMYESLIDYPPAGMLKADAVGAGCMVVKRTVLEKMQARHIAQTNGVKKRLRASVNGSPKAQRDLEWLLKYADGLSPWFEFLDQKGEDFYFCERAAESGYMVWVNLDVKCEHLGQLPIGEGHFMYLKEQGMIIRLDPDGNPMEERLPAPQTVGGEAGGAE